MITQHPDLARAVWRVSTYSGNSGNCVQVADLPGGSRAVRHSKNSAGSVLIFTRDEWVAFCAGVRDGEFD